MKILTIVGARPQFVKASVVSKAVSAYSNLREVIVHTGQHFDENMSEIFFRQLDIPRPNYQLDINGGGHGQMTGRMLSEIETILLREEPDRVLVYGDTNSTLAGALAAVKLHIPVAHVEAGLRSFNMKMPEEVNRILTDQISDILFCPTMTAVRNLETEGFGRKPVKVLNVGDVMQDSVLYFAKHAPRFEIEGIEDRFILATLHRAENTDDPIKLANIVSAINELHQTVAQVVLPLHPRTRNAIQRAGITLAAVVIAPVGYLEMIDLLRRCSLVLTDSGGIQKEAFLFGKACVTLREQTEWVELVELGANQLVGSNKESIVKEAKANFGKFIKDTNELYGGGKASMKVAGVLANSDL